MEQALHDCKIHGHRFSPRYDTTIDPDEPEDLPELRVYVCDICIRCGSVVKRGNRKRAT